MQDDFSLDSYDYHLPEEKIAQQPAAKREHSKLFVYNRRDSSRQHLHFCDIIDFFRKGDLLVVNDTKVIPARLFGKKETGGKAEVFLLELPVNMSTPLQQEGKNILEATALIKSSKRPAIGSTITIAENLHCQIQEHHDGGKVRLYLKYPVQSHIMDVLEQHGNVPLPPYIERREGTSDKDKKRYQTVYAKNNGAVAAPTAGLHFTKEIFTQLEQKGVSTAHLTLHVGYGTFAPVRTEDIKDHQIHSEYISLTEETAEQINRVKEKGGKVWAVGTTSVRTLEFCSDEQGKLKPYSGWCDLYIFPGFKYKVIDNLITNFHLPKSSLLFLVSALCGREELLSCYREAMEKDYRFFSYGDAMAIIG